MRRCIFGVLSAFAFILAGATFSTMSAAQDGSGGELIPVCVEYFESTPGVEYLTQEQIDAIEAEWAAYDYSDAPPPRITGYPDPATGSCATEDGSPTDYDPDIYTLVCVGSGPDGEGPLVPQLGINIYLEGTDVILADPETGECPQDETTEVAPEESVDEAIGDTEADDTSAVTTDEDTAAEDPADVDAGAVDTDSNEELTVSEGEADAPAPEGRAAAVYTGSCDRLDDVAVELPNIVEPQGRAVGQASAIEAATASTTVNLSLDVLLDEEHAIVVVESNSLDSDVIACGDIGGVDNDDGELVVGLGEVDRSGFTGMVYLAYSADDESQTGVSIFLAEGLAETP